MAGLSLFGAHKENGLAQAAPRVVQFREEHVGRGDAAVVRGRRTDRDEVGRGAHLHWWGLGRELGRVVPSVSSVLCE